MDETTTTLKYGQQGLTIESLVEILQEAVIGSLLLHLEVFEHELLANFFEAALHSWFARGGGRTLLLQVDFPAKLNGPLVDALSLRSFWVFEILLDLLELRVDVITLVHDAFVVVPTPGTVRMQTAITIVAI